jgi:putative oxidoreductase
MSNTKPNSNSFIVTLARGYAMLARIESYFQSPFLLLIRLYWGWSFFQTGKGKLLDLSKPTDYFTSLHIPFPHANAVLVGCVECFGGLLLLLGLGSRLITIPLIINMIVAYLAADMDKVKNIFNDPDKFVTADPFLFLLASVIIFSFGPGLFSLDALIGYLFKRSHPEALPLNPNCPPRPPVQG